MPLISKSVPSVFTGVSQQPAPLRGPSQCEASDNAYPSLSVGLRKRPPTKHQAKLTNTTASSAWVGVFNYSAADKYIITVLDEDLKVYHTDGTACTITALNRTAWAAATGYALGAVRRPTVPNGFQYRVTTAGTSAGAQPVWPLVLGGTVVDNTVTWTCVPDYLNSATPRSEFSGQVIGDSVLIVNKTVTVAMKSDVVPGALTGTKQTFGSLPAAAGSGNIYQVLGDSTNRFDNYYVKDDAATTTWIEWLKPGETYRLDPQTMPHKLVRTGKYTFTFDPAGWLERAVGDKAAVADPSFIGKQIQDVFLYRNRLGFIADEFVVMSKSADFYNLYPGTATAVLDDDPIDLTTSGQKKTVLRYAIPFNTALLLFSEQTQYQLSGGDVLSPRTCRVDPVTEFESDPNCRPVALGQEVYFGVNRQTNTAVRNYFIDTEALTNDASDVTAHVPNYVPQNVFKMTASTTEDLVCAFTLQERNRIYLYKFYWQEDKKVQAAWQRFTFDATDEILGAEFINNVLYLIVQRADGIYYETMDMQPSVIDSDLGFLCTLDRRVSLSGTYDAANDWTTWTLPYSDAGNFQAVLPSAFTGRKGEVFDCSRPSNTAVRVPGNLSANPVYIGRKYILRYRLSEIYFKDGNGLPVLG